MEELVHMPLSNGQTLWRMRAKLLIIIRLRYYTSQKTHKEGPTNFNPSAHFHCAGALLPCALGPVRWSLITPGRPSLLITPGRPSSSLSLTSL